MKNSPNVIAISYAKRALEKDSRERERMKEYASVLGSYHVIVFTKKNAGYPEIQQEGSLTLYATNSASKLGMLLKAIKIGKSIIKNNTGSSYVVSSQDPFETSFVARAIARANAKHHIQIHGDVFNPLYFKKTFLNSLRIWYGKRVVRKAEKIRVVSNRIKGSVCKLGVEASKITVLPIQPELDTFLQVGIHKHYTTTTALKILFVGRFSLEKNILLLLDAVALAKKESARCTVHLMGDGPQKESLQKHIKKIGLEDVVEFLPWKNDVASVMSTADVLCLSSNHEGYGMVLLEAMASGLPVVTTDVGCAGEVVLDEVHGFVVPVGDTKSFAKALCALATNPAKREAFGRRALEDVQLLQCSRAEYLEKIRNSFLTEE